MLFTAGEIQEIVAGARNHIVRQRKKYPRWPAIGSEYKFELLITDWNDWAPADVNNTRYPGDGVYNRHYKHGGWLSGDCCIEPEWWDVAQWVIGNTYAVCPGRGRPALYWMPDRHDHPMAVEPDRVRCNGHTLWDEAKSDVFVADNQAHPHEWMLNNAGARVEIHITDIITLADDWWIEFDLVHSRGGW